MPIGFTLPFSVSSGSVGYFETTNTALAATAEDLKSLLLTNWGERLNHYYMGCNLREFLFENYEARELRNKIAERIMNQVERWLPFVSIKSLDILTNELDQTVQTNSIRIKLSFVLSSRPDLIGKVDQTVSQ